MNRKMRVIVAGGRNFADRARLWGELDKQFLRVLDHVTIISGHARGADSMGEEWANAHGLTVENGGLEIFPADWDGLGKKAGIIRNHQMGETCTHLIAFFDGKSIGTKDMIDYAIRLGRWVKVVRYDE